jgi:uncharacterized protein YndB with AHSA1/START domain
MPDSTYIIASIIIDAPLEKVWEAWTNPSHIKNWNFSTNEWKIDQVMNDLKMLGQFHINYRDKNGSFAHEVKGTYTNVESNKMLKYINKHGRTSTVEFIEKTNINNLSHLNTKGIQIILSISANTTDEMLKLQLIHQNILSRFKYYMESTSKP